MKKTITLLTALIISASIFACHPQPTGFCTGSAYFKLIAFEAGFKFEYKYMDGGILKDTVISTIDSSEPSIHIPQPSSNTTVKIMWRFKKLTGGWQTITGAAWDTTKSLCGINSYLCYTVMPVQMSNLTASQSGKNLTVSFTAGAEDLDHYNIQVSNDAVNWKTVQVLKATKAGSYKTVINLMGGTTAALGLLGFVFIGFKEKRRLLALLVAFCCIFYISCSKELTKPDNNVSYKYARVQPVDINGQVNNSNIVTIAKR